MGLLVGATTQTMVISCYISPYTDPVVPSKYGWAMMTRFFFTFSDIVWVHRELYYSYTLCELEAMAHEIVR